MRNKNLSLALSLLALAAGMVMLAYASVPLYRLFCQVTGFGGTTQQAKEAPGRVSSRILTVRFNADTAPGLSWRFTPLQIAVDAAVGENTLAFYEAENTGSAASTGTATFNVTPHKAGQYFVKVHCFCFEEQKLQPGETMEMPVSFYIDPAILKDRQMEDVHTITLSYTFFPVEKP